MKRSSTANTGALMAVVLVSAGLYAAIEYSDGRFRAASDPSVARPLATESDPATPGKQTEEQPPTTAVAAKADNPAATDAAQTTPAKAGEPAAQTATPAAKPATAAATGNEVFIPTEEISEDLSVSFPVDI